MNFAMWRKALTVIPNVSKEEWDGLDTISKWLISTRAAVLVMTIISAVLAGLFAWRDNAFNLLPWVALTVGLVLAHASNNLLNDYVDYFRGVDRNNYFRTMYGPHPLENQLMTQRQHLMYFAVTGFMALVCGLYLVWNNNFSSVAWMLLGSGAFFLLFYTWPLKYIALGEVTVLLVWGPLMVGGGYFVVAHRWDWNVLVTSFIYALGVTTVIFGKHIDKLSPDRERKINTLPAIIGEKISRYVVLVMMLLPYLLVGYVVLTGSFSWVILITLLALPRLRQVAPAFLQPKPEKCPTDFPQGQGGWPLYFAPLAFWHNRTFGSLFVFGLLVDVILKKIIT